MLVAANIVLFLSCANIDESARSTNIAEVVFPAQMRAARQRLAGSIVVEPAPTSSEVTKEGQQAFCQDLIDKWAAGRIGFVDLGTIAWLATRAGAKGVEHLSVKPGSTNAAKTLRLALGLPKMDDILFPARIPLWDSHLEARTIRTMSIKLPHEALARDYIANKQFYHEKRTQTS